MASVNATVEFDENVARQLDAVYQSGDAVRRRRLVRSALAAGPGDDVLDVGCGPGYLCAELADDVGTSGSVTGVDTSPQMLELATRRCSKTGRVQFRGAGAEVLPFEDESFDALACVQVLEYVTDVAACLREFRRVLRPGGRLVAWDVDWSTVSWHSTDSDRMQRVLRAWDRHLVEPALPRTLASAMRSAGFREIEMTAHPFASVEFDPSTYGTSAIGLIRSYVTSSTDVSAEEARAWAAEQRELGERKEYYFACLQVCFSGVR